VPSWTYNLPSALLAGNGQELPSILISQLSVPTGLSIMARDKDSPAEVVGFNMWFPSDKRLEINKLFFALGKNDGHGEGHIFLSSEKLKELTEQKFISLK
jgi:hypothetical protein